MMLRGDLIRLGWGYYATASLAEMAPGLSGGQIFLSAAAAAAALGPSAVVSHQTAAIMHGLSLIGPPPAFLCITRPPGVGSRSARPGIRLHSAALPDAHVGGRFAVPMTTVPRTVIDLGRTLTFREAVVVADSALQQRLASKKELQTVLAACRRWPGITKAAAVVEFADKRAESPLESLARVVFLDCRLPAPELQVEIRDSEFIGRVDFLWREFNTIAEVDGAMKYDDRQRAVRELRRDKRLREAGYQVVHFDWKEINGNPAYVAASLRAAFAAGGRPAETLRSGD
jgi:very-short-patch-repair endonuclease